MTLETPSSRVVPVTRQLVYVRRRAAAQAALPINGETAGWVLDPHLLCTSLQRRAGANGALANLEYQPSTPTEFRINHAMSYYGGDDQVRVCVMPIEDELVDQPAVDQAPVLFEGILSVAQFAIETTRGVKEKATFVARPIHALDNTLTEHLITGRWMFDRETETTAAAEKPFIAYAPDLPAVFNFHGRRNQSKQRVGVTIGADETKLRGPVFTHDDDPAGKFWTVRSALAALVVFWQYGPDHRFDGTDEYAIAGMTRNRNTCVSAALLAELVKADDAKGEGAFTGMERQLPECNVTGMHVLSAIERVCDLAGFGMALDCVTTPTFEEDASVDRRYQLRVWSKGRGTAKELYLAKPGSTYARAEQFFKSNNLHSITLLRDHEAIVTEIVSTGDSYIEGAIVLKPAWTPDEVDAADPDRTFESVTDAKKAGSGYWSKHCKDGRLFPQYGYVGRVWVADCVGDPFGEAGTNVSGYPSGEYDHEDQGFDFCEALGLQATGNAVESERASLGLANPTLRWSNRVRRALPLRSPASQAIGDDYILEVSEDGGTTWQPTEVPKATLREYFGIKLNISNLAVVNNKSFGADGRPCSWRDSWWRLIKQELLLFRLTCAIRSDSGAVVHLARSGQSGSNYATGQLMVQRGVEEVWQALGSPVNPTSGVHRKVLGFGGWGATTPSGAYDLHTWTNQLRDAAALRQAQLQQRRLSARATLFLFAFNQYALGDCITMIRGRDISLGTNQGAAATYPNIVGIDLILAPGDQQGMVITMEDHALGGE